MDPPRPASVQAAGQLNYRDFLTVVLIVEQPRPSPTPGSTSTSQRQARPRPELQELVPRPGPRPDKSSLGLEYFCFEGDGLWTMSDADLIALGTREMRRHAASSPAAEVIDGCVVRMPKAYPVYDDVYQATWPRSPGSLAFPNLDLAGATACTSTTTRTTR